VRLFNYLWNTSNDSTAAKTVGSWVASEYLQAGSNELLAAYDGVGI
jgi:hypothetical protein